MRVLIALTQAVIIVAVGSLLFGVEIIGSLIARGRRSSILGAMAFLALGYVIASFAKTEDAANGMTSMIQFPMMFLSGAFFPIDQMPQFLQVVARLIPLTYLADALRQVMVGGAAVRAAVGLRGGPRSAGWSSASRSRRASSSGSSGGCLPALLADHLVERRAGRRLVAGG